MDEPTELAERALQLWSHANDSAEIFINGVSVAKSERQWTLEFYREVVLADGFPLRPGRNVVAVHARNLEGQMARIDVGLYRSLTADDLRRALADER